MKPVHLDRAALEELFEASDWYESSQTGLSDRFLDDFEQLLVLVRAHPSAFPVLQASPPDLAIRRALFHRFPYGVVFLELDAEIRVVAVAHHKRRPLYWLSRIRE